MNILFLTMDATQIGGIEKSLANLLPALNSKSDYNIFMMSCFGSSKTAGFDFGSTKIIYLNRGRSNFISGSFASKFQNYLKLVSTIRKLNLDYYSKIISVYPIISILIIIFHGKYSGRLYSWEHSQISGHSRALNLLRFLMYRFIKKIIVLTDNQKMHYSNLSKRISVIPNIVNNTNIIKESKCEKTHIIGVGRLSYEKGFDRFLNVLKILKELRSDWYATIYGSGEELNNLKNLINHYMLENFVCIKENFTDPQKIYGDADILALCSRSEVFGMVIIESMQAGVPIVAYQDGDGPSELIDNCSNGIVIPSDNDIEFARSIIKLMDNKGLYEKIAFNGKLTGKKFTSDLVIKKWQEIFDE